MQGDYYIPCLILDKEGAQLTGMWDRKYLRYIRARRPVLHITLLLSCELNIRLAEIDNRAAESTGSNGMGQCYEQHPQYSERNRFI